MVEIKEYIGHKPVELKETVIKIKSKNNNTKQTIKKEEIHNGVQKNNQK